MYVYANDLPLLTEVARDSGLQSPGARRFLWPLLTRVDPSKLNGLNAQGPPHALTDQVAKDVNRSMFLVEKKDRSKMRAQLSEVINKVLDANPSLSYYQGFHDITTVILLVCKKPALTKAVVERLALR